MKERYLEVKEQFNVVFLSSILYNPATGVYGKLTCLIIYYILHRRVVFRYQVWKNTHFTHTCLWLPPALTLSVKPFIIPYHTQLLSQLDCRPYRSRKVFIQISLAKQKQDALVYTQQGAASWSRGIFRVLFTSWGDTQSEQASEKEVRFPLSDNSASPLPAVLPRSKPLENKSRSEADPFGSGCCIVFKDVTQKEPLRRNLFKHPRDSVQNSALSFWRISVQSK